MIRRLRVALTLLFVSASLWVRFGPIAATPETPPVVSAVEAIGMTVADMDRSVAFYRDVLGFERQDDTRLASEASDRLHGIEGAQLRVVGMRLGEERIELAQWLTPRGRPVPRDSRSHDRWFAVLRGGTHHFRLPAAWGYSHPFTVLPMPWDEPFDRPAVRDAAVDAVGELCTPRDVLTRGQPVTELRVGDVLVFARTGAYGWDISHHEFLRHPYPQRLVI